MKELNYISTQIIALIKREAREQAGKQEDYELRYRELVSEIRNLELRNKEWMQETKDQGFNVNLAEAEGYQRCIKELEYLLEEE